MPGSPDYAITNRARAVLRRHWVDAGTLTCGCVNGVVYLRGELRQDPLYRVTRSQRAAVAADDELALIHAVERDLGSIDGVKDVIFQIEGFERRGDHWERTRLLRRRTGS